jgi:hypothetical protein
MKKERLITTNYNYEQLAEAWQIELDKVALIYQVINQRIDLASFESVDRLRRQCYNPPDTITEQMEAINELIEGHGVESIQVSEDLYQDRYWGNAIGLYVNQGDTYDLTVVYNVIDSKFEFTSWGDFFESMESQLQSENDDL